MVALLLFGGCVGSCDDGCDARLFVGMSGCAVCFGGVLFSALVCLLLYLGVGVVCFVRIVGVVLGGCGGCCYAMVLLGVGWWVLGGMYVGRLR